MHFIGEINKKLLQAGLAYYYPMDLNYQQLIQWAICGLVIGQKIDPH